MIFDNQPVAFIFDMDGLLIDSEPLWRRAEISVLATVGVQLTDEMCKETMGSRLDEMVAYWYARFPWTGKSQPEIAREILTRVTTLIMAEGEAMPGVQEILDRLLAQGMPLGLASSSPPELIEAVLTRLKIQSAFSVVCSAVDEALGKPDPGVYLTAARQLGVDPVLCVALEDSLAGVASAAGAGMMVVAVSPERGKNRFPQAFLEVRSLLELLPMLGY